MSYYGTDGDLAESRVSSDAPGIELEAVEAVDLDAAELGDGLVKRVSHPRSAS